MLQRSATLRMTSSRRGTTTEGSGSPLVRSLDRMPLRFTRSIVPIASEIRLSTRTDWMTTALNRAACIAALNGFAPFALQEVWRVSCAALHFSAGDKPQDIVGQD